MPNEEEIEDEAARPQDDPRHGRAVAAAIAAYRVDHPPLNCWMASPSYLDLYIRGLHRAKVEIGNALITIFDEQGKVAEEFPYLQSESAFDVAEQRLGTGRVNEVRDESDEGGGAPDPYLRAADEEAVRSFRKLHAAPGEARHYLREAIRTLEAITAHLPDSENACLALLHEADGALGEGKRETARKLIANAAALPDATSFTGGGARRDCLRAVTALDRDMAPGSQPANRFTVKP